MIAQQHIKNLKTQGRREAFFRLHETKRFYIWSAEHKAFWRPGGRGYTADTAAAGIWSLNAAYDLTEHSRAEKLIFYKQTT